MELFPVTESTLSAQHLGRLIQDKYALSGKSECKLFRTGINHLYIVSDGNKKFVFRVYTFLWRTRSEISEEVRLLTHLKENNISVSYPIADANGEFIQEMNAPEGMRYGVLFSYAEGFKQSLFSGDASYNIGRMMAEMHRVTENFEINRATYNNATLLNSTLTDY